jgi:hypothetical protein
VDAGRLDQVANKEHLDILKSGVAEWNYWRKDNPDEKPLLDGADLSWHHLKQVDFRGAVLNAADFSHSVLTQADFTGAILRNATFHNAYLVGANMETAELNQAIMTYADARGSCFRYAFLMGVDFREAKLDGSDFTLAKIGWTDFGRNNLSQVLGLDTVRHVSSSMIGIDTIYRSNASISKGFLLAAGVPEVFVTYMESLSARTFEFYTCFISHSTKDKSFCDRLYLDLQANQVRTWYFPENAKWGESVWGEIDSSIKVYEKTILVCSQNSLKSGPVLREIERALNREDREARSILFPVRIDDFVFDGWEHERKDDVLRKVVGDFSRWKTKDKYERAFRKLLDSLKPEGTRLNVAHRQGGFVR